MRLLFAALLMFVMVPEASFGSGPRVPAKELSGIIIRQAEPLLPESAVELRVVRLEIPEGFLARVNPERMGVHFQKHEDFSGATLVRVDLDGKSRWLSVEFELQVLAAVAREPLRRGGVLRIQDLEVRPVPLQKFRGAKPPAVETLPGQILAAGLRAGEPVMGHMLRRPVIVKRGQRVEIEVRGDGVRVRTAGVAQAAGRLGDSISVKNRSARTRLVGVVCGPGQVRIDLSGTRTGGLP